MSTDARDPLGGRSVLALADLALCFEGVVPAVIATASRDGVPNVTYLSRVRVVDDDHIALSNQFFSKTSHNLAENPRASILLINPLTYDEFRLTVTYERTERRGRVFERLREDVDVVAAITGMQEVFKLKAADVYRVLHVEQVVAQVHLDLDDAASRSLPSLAPITEPVTDRTGGRGAVQLAEINARLSRCADLDSLVTAALDALDDVLGFRHSMLALLDEDGARLYTIATHGYGAEGIGSEIAVGKGVIGMAAARSTLIRVGNLRQMDKYSRSVRLGYEEAGEIGPGRTIPVPGLPRAESRVAVPAMALGQLVGVLTVDSLEQVAFDESDEAFLTMVASLVASAIEIERAQERSAEAVASTAAPVPRGQTDSPHEFTRVRFFAVDGSTFLDDDYLIKGVAGRILWSLLGHHEHEGRVEFTNREVRLDPTLELPEFRDNFESRLILLKRRLDEHGAPIRIEKTGRGRFRLQVDTTLRLESVSPPG